jgi:hypothetical protein
MATSVNGLEPTASPLKINKLLKNNAWTSPKISDWTPDLALDFALTEPATTANSLLA